MLQWSVSDFLLSNIFLLQNLLRLWKACGPSTNTMSSSSATERWGRWTGKKETSHIIDPLTFCAKVSQKKLYIKKKIVKKTVIKFLGTKLKKFKKGGSKAAASTIPLFNQKRCGQGWVDLLVLAKFSFSFFYFSFSRWATALLGWWYPRVCWTRGSALPREFTGHLLSCPGQAALLQNVPTFFTKLF